MKTLSINIFGPGSNDKIIFVDEFSRAISLILKNLDMPYKNLVYISDINGYCNYDIAKILDIYTKDKENCDCIIACIQATDVLFMDDSISKKDRSEDSIKGIIEDYLSSYYKNLSDLGFINVQKSLFSNTTPDYNTLYFIYNNFAGVTVLNYLANINGCINEIINPCKIREIDFGCNTVPEKEDDIDNQEKKDDFQLPEFTGKEKSFDTSIQQIPDNDFGKLVDHFIEEEPYKGDNIGGRS